jgi:hypothetical protein
VQQVTGTPPLSQRPFALLFKTLVATLCEHPFPLNATSKASRGRLFARRDRISRDSVCMVLKGITYKTNSIPVQLENMSVLGIAHTFARNVIDCLTQRTATSAATQPLDGHSTTTYHYSLTVGCRAKKQPQKLVQPMGSTAPRPFTPKQRSTPS